MDSPTNEREGECLQPELLTKDKLIEIISHKCPHIGQLHTFDQNSLVDLFYKNVAALPQRKYRRNRRGLQMAKVQIMMDKRRKRTHDEISTIVTSAGQNGSSSNFTIKSSSDRLRPPPSAINQDRKIIKLGQNRKTASEATEKSTSTSIRVTNNSNIDVNKSVSKISFHKNGSSENKTLESIKSESNAPKIDVANPKIVKIMPEVSKSPAVKVKLKRPSAMTFEKVTSGAEEMSTSELDSKVTPIYVPTKDARCVSNTEPGADPVKSPEKPELEDTAKEEDLSDEASVRKKFKRVSVKWP